MILEKEKCERQLMERLFRAKPQYNRAGVYRYSYEQNAIFYDLVKKYEWSIQSVKLLQLYMKAKKLSILDAYKKVKLERNIK